MGPSHPQELVKRAEYLLMVLARDDVEDMGGRRQRILHELQDLEAIALRNQIDLYDRVVKTT